MVSRVRGMTTNRVHHLLSNLELGFFFMLDWRDDVLDIREQYPLLDMDLAMRIAKEAGIAYPTDRKSGFPFVMTSDFLVTTDNGDQVFSVKPRKELNSMRTKEKLELERRYWKEQGVPWELITEDEINFEEARNIEWISKSLLLPATFPNEQLLRDSMTIFANFYNTTDDSIVTIAAKTEDAMGLPAGTGIRIFQYLLLKREIRCDLKEPLKISRPRREEPFRTPTYEEQSFPTLLPIDVNRVYYEPETDRFYRLLWLSPDRDFGYWIDIFGKPRIPSRMDLDVLERS